jgi:hypothetical protein
MGVPPVDRKQRGLRVDDQWRGAEVPGNTSLKGRVREGGAMMGQWKRTEARHSTAAMIQRLIEAEEREMRHRLIEVA